MVHSSLVSKTASNSHLETKRTFAKLCDTPLTPKENHIYMPPECINLGYLMKRPDNAM